MADQKTGKIKSVAGPLVIAKDMRGCEMYEVVRVGRESLMGETIKLMDQVDKAIHSHGGWPIK